MSILKLDPRWRALMESTGIIDIGFDHPSDWPHGARGDAPFVKEGADQLTSELCRAGERRFIRAALSLPIRGSDEALMVALWAEVPHTLFYAYLDTLDGGAPPAQTEATLANDLAPVVALNTAFSLEFGDGTTRPAAKFTPDKDISLDELLALYEASGTLNRDDLTR